ncbi:MAG: hypothetical protein LBB65_06290 [Burkholderiales bacterium]|jgi:type IV pilus assembly protein PilY1|nr:hypothetical protein [Burkholderiales bacterium]
MKNHSHFLRAKRSTLRSESLFLALGLLLPGSLLAQPVQLSDTPLAAESRTPTAVMLIADDSVSMSAAFTPDNLGAGTGTDTSLLIQSACYTTATTTTCGTTAPLSACWNTCDTTDAYTGANYTAVKEIFKGGQPPLSAAALNGMAYNPLVTYTPPIQPDGTSFPSMDGSSAANGGAGWTNVVWNTSLWTANNRPPAVNLKTLTLANTAIQSYALQNRYMIGAKLPSATMTSPPITVSGTGSATTYTFPVHYFRTSVKWCKSKRTSGVMIGSADPGAISVAGTKLSFGNCADEYLAGTYIYPYYYSPSADYNLDVNAANNLNKPAFDLVVLDPVNIKVATVNAENNWTFTVSGTVNHWYLDEVEGTKVKITRTAQEEITNYANWAAYYRNRFAAVKAAASLAFSGIHGNRISAGFVTINTTATRMPASLGTLEDFGSASSAPNRTTFYNNLIGFEANGSGTPLRTALDAVGNKFGSTYINASSANSCQKNHVIMFTDGRWNDSYSRVGNWDMSVQRALPTTGNIDIYGTSMNPAATGTPWPTPIYDATNTANTLADIALYYWSNRLGPATLGNKVAAVQGKDPATWPHLNFHGMGFGVKGTLPSSDQKATLAKIKNKTLHWPSPNATTNPLTTVDDLWHATVNGFGRYVSAGSPDDFRRGLNGILNEISNISGARAASAFTNRNTTDSDADNYNYSVSFLSGWSGDVVRRNILPSGEVDMKAGNTASAAANLETVLTATGTSTPWLDARFIFTRKGGEYSSVNAIPFQYDYLTPAQRGNLGASASTQKKMIAYLRGDKSNEGDGAGRFRPRTGQLGDIVDAAPIVVKNPGWNYDDNKNSGYEDFTKTNKARDTMVYVAANDGMLHAFDKDLNERWAYVPMDIIRDPAAGGIAALSFQNDDPIHPFRHLFYVNATPRTQDVKIGKEWKTVLVGGLGKGGKSYYALDVTDSKAVTNEAAGAQAKSLWEFTDPDMGYTFGRPILTKTNAWDNPDAPGETKWVAILPSGYSNASGKACLFFVDLATGAKVSGRDELCTTEGTANDPLEMVAIGGYVKDPHDQVMLYVYGGDQKGNFWRFDLTDTDSTHWIAEKFAMLQDSAGNKQYVTTEPWPQDSETGGHFVLVGTGGFRNDADLTAKTPVNTFYSFYDNWPAPITLQSRGNLSEISSAKGNLLSGTSDPDKGWYQDIDAGYHINVNPQSAFYIAAWAANSYISNTSTNPCSMATLSGKFYAHTVSRGKPALGETTAGAGDGTIPYISVPTGISGFTLLSVLGHDGNSRLTIGIDDTSGSLITLDNNSDLGKLGGSSPASNLPSVPKRIGIRFIDN